MTDSRRSGWATWGRLPGALADSLDVRCLALASLGLLLTWLGAWVVSRATGGPVPNLPVNRLGAPALARPWEAPGPALAAVAEELARPYMAVARPFAETLRIGGGTRRWFVAFGAGLWSLAVWSLFGASIARVAVVRATDEGASVGFAAALRFSLARVGALLLAPLGPMLAIGLLVGFCALIGLGYQGDTEIGRAIAGGLGFLPVLAGLAMAVILLGLAAGWPLMVLTVAAEGEDGFDAVSRAYSYAGHRPLKYAGALLFCGLVGAAGVFLVIWGGGLALHLAAWGTSFGAPDESARGLYRPGPGAAGFWGRLVWLAVVAWPFSFFWAAVARVYLLLRLDVDGKPWEQVYMPSREAPPGSPAPPVEVRETPSA